MACLGDSDRRHETEKKQQAEDEQPSGAQRRDPRGQEIRQGRPRRPDPRGEHMIRTEADGDEGADQAEGEGAAADGGDPEQLRGEKPGEHEYPEGGRLVAEEPARQARPLGRVAVEKGGDDLGDVAIEGGQAEGEQ